MIDILSWESLTKSERPFFIYDYNSIMLNYSILTKSLNIRNPRSEIFFSVKSNPNIELLKYLNSFIFGFDVSSYLELKALKKIGVPSNRITMSGPGKTDQCLKEALKQNISCIHLDSTDEYLKALEYSDSGLTLPKLTLRLQTKDDNSKLGFFKNEIRDILHKRKSIKFSGLHSYLGRESYSHSNLQNQITEMENIINEFSSSFSTSPQLYIGPGIPSLTNFSFDQNMIYSKYPLYFELGRSLMSNAGYYAAPVLSVKDNIVIINGGVHHLGSPLISVFTRGASSNYFFIRDYKKIENYEVKDYSFYGSLCLSHDCIHPRIAGPTDLRRDDWIVFSECGAYGISAAVPFFIGQDLPEEYAYTLDLEKGASQTEDITPAHFKPYHESFEL